MPQPVNVCIPYKRPGQDLTGHPTAPVVGKRFVAISGNVQSDGAYSVAPPAAGGRVLGVATHDAAIGKRVPIIANPGVILPVAAGAINLPAFGEVQVDAQGRVIALAGGVAVGYLVTAGPGVVGDDAQVRLY